MSVLNTIGRKLLGTLALIAVEICLRMAKERIDKLDEDVREHSSEGSPPLDC